MSHFSREDALFFDIAHEGAQVRAVGQAAHLLAGLYDVQPRSVVVLATDQVAAAAARAVATFAAPLEVPVVVVDVLPAYVGALDVVVVVGDNAGSKAAKAEELGRPILNEEQFVQLLEGGPDALA